MKKSSLFILSFSIFCSTVLSGCASLVKEPSDAEINAQAAKAYEEVKAKSKMSTNPEWNAMVQKVVKRIAAASNENFQWEAVVIESKEVNAWCMPGGKIAVYTGIIPVLKTEGALAAVLGHEVAHATMRHGKQRYARAMQEAIAGQAIAVAAAVGGQALCKTDSCKQLAGMTGAAAVIGMTFFSMKYSREDETEADQVGQVYMAKAGYEPSEAIRLWERMSAGKGGKEQPEFMSTHPSDSRRRANLQKWLPEAEALYEQAPQKYGVGAAI